MILCAEIGLLVFGIITLIRGQYGMGKGEKIVGAKARLLGAICLAPLPLSMIVGLAIGFSNPQAVSAGSFKWLIAGIEIAILVSTVIVLVVLSKKFYRQQESSAQNAV
jgi:hypothetical protein